MHGVKYNPIKFYPLLNKKRAKEDLDGSSTKSTGKDGIVFLNGFSRHEIAK